MWNAVEMSTFNNLLTAANGSLIFHEFRPEHFRPDVHATTYRCSAINSVGRILSTPVRVRAGKFFNCPPHFFNELQNLLIEFIFPPKKISHVATI